MSLKGSGMSGCDGTTLSRKVGLVQSRRNKNNQKSDLTKHFGLLFVFFLNPGSLSK